MVEGDIRGLPGCVEGDSVKYRVDAVLGTGVRDDNEGMVAVGSNSQRILPTLTGVDPFLKLFLREDGEDGLREREGESDDTADNEIESMLCSSRCNVIPKIG